MLSYFLTVSGECIYFHVSLLKCWSVTVIKMDPDSEQQHRITLALNLFLLITLIWDQSFKHQGITYFLTLSWHLYFEQFMKEVNDRRDYALLFLKPQSFETTLVSCHLRPSFVKDYKRRRHMTKLSPRVVPLCSPIRAILVCLLSSLRLQNVSSAFLSIALEATYLDMHPHFLEMPAD